MARKRGDASRRETCREVFFTTLMVVLLVMGELAFLLQNLYLTLGAGFVLLLMFVVLRIDKEDDSPISL